jgi:hypothetical protein
LGSLLIIDQLASPYKYACATSKAANRRKSNVEAKASQPAA